MDTTHWGLHALVVVADIDLALERALTAEQRKVVLLHGLLGAPQRNVAEWFGINQATVSRRYETALELIQWHLNGGA
jgi:DNA-directed RNA polymerase specialized sigma24 family protein